MHIQKRAHFDAYASYVVVESEPKAETMFLIAHVLRLATLYYKDALPLYKAKFLDAFNKVVLAATSPLPAATTAACMPLLPLLVTR